MNLSPILLFVYNRPHHTKQTIEALQKNDLAKESELFIYSDAPKNESAKQDVEEVRSYIKSIDGFKDITIIEREKNFGLADSIIDGVTEIVNRYGKVIVLEDDLVTSPYFLRFMNEALEFYEYEEKVMHISGYVYPIDNSGLNNTYFIKPTTCWGWATWKSSWSCFKKDASYYIEIFDKKMVNDFNLNGAYDYFSQIVANKTGEMNTWAIFWYASVYINGGLSLHPKESFVKNIGHDGEGVHCGKTSVFDVPLSNKHKFKFETIIKENIKARKKFEDYFNSIKPRFYKKFLVEILKMLKIYNFAQNIHRKMRIK